MGYSPRGRKESDMAEVTYHAYMNKVTGAFGFRRMGIDKHIQNGTQEKHFENLIPIFFLSHLL